MELKYIKFNPTPFETHMLVYDRIKSKSNVLDIGCATGYFAKKLQEKKCKVWGIDSDKGALAVSKKYCVATYATDIENLPSIPFRQKFDYILLLDVIEHLKNPNRILQTTQRYLEENGRFIISTPNIAFISNRISHLAGKFEYTDIGIMDVNHVRFYTKSSLLSLLLKNRLKVEILDSASGFSQITFLGKYLNHIPKIWQYQITRLFDTLLTYQFIAVCTK